MKTVLTFVLMVATSYCIAQNNKAIKNYGNTLPVVDAELHLDTTAQYKVIFDIAKSPDQKNKVNSSINTVARFINMHVAQGVPLENLEIVVVVHGSAVKDYTTDEIYLGKFEVENPNAGLIKELKEAGVRTYMCGQSFGYRGYDKNDLSEHAKLALSAMTALVKFQGEGYQLIDFN